MARLATNTRVTLDSTMLTAISRSKLSWQAVFEERTARSRETEIRKTCGQEADMERKPTEDDLVDWMRTLARSRESRSRLRSAHNAYHSIHSATGLGLRCAESNWRV